MGIGDSYICRVSQSSLQLCRDHSLVPTSEMSSSHSSSVATPGWSPAISDTDGFPWLPPSPPPCHQSGPCQSQSPPSSPGPWEGPEDKDDRHRRSWALSFGEEIEVSELEVPIGVGHTPRREPGGPGMGVGALRRGGVHTLVAQTWWGPEAHCPDENRGPRAHSLSGSLSGGVWPGLLLTLPPSTPSCLDPGGTTGMQGGRQEWGPTPQACPQCLLPVV